MASCSRGKRHVVSKVGTLPTKNSSAAMCHLALAAALFLSPPAATATVFQVSPEGSPYSIAGALTEAGPGDVVSLADGIYDEPIVTMAGGVEGSPLVIEGGRGAVINGASGDMHKAVFVQHSWVTLQVKAVSLVLRTHRYTVGLQAMFHTVSLTLCGSWRISWHIQGGELCCALLAAMPDRLPVCVVHLRR